MLINDIMLAIVGIFNFISMSNTSERLKAGTVLSEHEKKFYKLEASPPKENPLIRCHP